MNPLIRITRLETDLSYSYKKNSVRWLSFKFKNLDLLIYSYSYFLIVNGLKLFIIFNIF